MGMEPFAERLIRIKAHQLVTRGGFTESDRHDIEQELTLYLVEHLPEHDPDRSSRRTFIVRLVENRVADLVRHRTAEMRDPRHVERSLDERVEDGEGGETDMVSTMAGNERTPGELRDAAIDLAEVLPELPPRLRTLCRRLPDATMQEIADELGVSRRTVYRWLEEVRTRFEEAGLDDYI